MSNKTITPEGVRQSKENVIIVRHSHAGNRFLINEGAIDRWSHEFPEAFYFGRREAVAVAKKLHAKAVIGYGQQDEEVIADFQKPLPTPFAAAEAQLANQFGDEATLLALAATGEAHLFSVAVYLWHTSDHAGGRRHKAVTWNFNIQSPGFSDGNYFAGPDEQVVKLDALKDFAERLIRRVETRLDRLDQAKRDAIGA